MRTFLMLSSILLLLSCQQPPKQLLVEDVTIDTLQGTSLLDVSLIRKQVDPQRDSARITNYIEAYNTYIRDTTNIEALVWVGRRVAYLGDYKKAIAYYSNGIAQHPQEARFYRHRGHRYISLRQFDQAIADFNRAAQLIENTDDQVEQDGIPNRLNTPVSTLHTNIYYHLGLAHYVKNQLPNALMAFTNCLKISKNDDMQVATRHWLYMIHRRLGNIEKTKVILEPISKEMNIIENNAYHKLLMFYKGELTEAELTGAEATGSSEAIQYGVANWYHYNDSIAKATMLYKNLVAQGNWAGFGFIAAEADLNRFDLRNLKK